MSNSSGGCQCDGATGVRPWETAIYARTISINRPALDITAGDVGYIGQTRQTETVLFTDIPASVQGRPIGNSRRGDGKIAADAPGPVAWNIFVPASALAKGSVNDRDIVIDDEGNRYLVAGNYWNILGYKIECIRLET